MVLKKKRLAKRLGIIRSFIQSHLIAPTDSSRFNCRRYFTAHVVCSLVYSLILLISRLYISVFAPFSPSFSPRRLFSRLAIIILSRRRHISCRPRGIDFALFFSDVHLLHLSCILIFLLPSLFLSLSYSCTFCRVYRISTKGKHATRWSAVPRASSPSARRHRQRASLHRHAD